MVKKGKPEASEAGRRGQKRASGRLWKTPEEDAAAANAAAGGCRAQVSP